MQSNTLSFTLGTGNTRAVTRIGEDTNRSTYIFDATHSIDSRDTMQLYRTYPKRSGQSRGSAKCAIKFTQDISVDNADGSGSIVLPLIAEINFSMPVGATAAQVAELQERCAAILTGTATPPGGFIVNTDVVDDLTGILEI